MPKKDASYLKIAKKISSEDLSPTLEITTTILKNLGGRPATYPNTSQGLQSFIENSQGFFEYVQKANSQLDDDKKLIPDIELYLLWLGISRWTLSEYQHRGGEWEKIINMFKDSILVAKKQLILRGKIPPVIAIFDLTNNHGYRNTNSFVLEDRTAADNDDNSELEKKITDAGLVWDNESHEFVPQERIEDAK